MKTAIQPPTLRHLSRAYYELGKLGARAVGKKSPWPYQPKTTEELLALCGGLARHDPRLFEILLQSMGMLWEKIDWLHLRRIVQKMDSPQTFGVIGEILSATRNSELANCFRFLMHGVRPAPTQLFYNNLYTPGGAMAQRALDKRLREFEKWGFLASERPALNADSKITAGRMSRSARLGCLQRLLKNRNPIQLQDYMTALSHPISRQQALLDMKEIKGLRHRGYGRGAVWHLAEIRKEPTRPLSVLKIGHRKDIYR